MHSKQVLTVITSVAVLSWSVVMAALGHVAAVAALVPSLGLLVQQIINAVTGTRPPHADAPPRAVAPDEGRAR
jgi:hypothetical protein